VKRVSAKRFKTLKTMDRHVNTYVIKCLFIAYF